MRLFISIDPPQSGKAYLERLTELLRAECPGWRWVSAGNLHLTLRFLGEVDPETRARLGEACAAAMARRAPGTLALGGVGAFPGRSRPRVLWCGVEQRPHGWLGHLARELETIVRGCGLPGEDRPFRPHITLARAPRGGRPTPPPGRTAAGIDPPDPFVVAQIHLVRSHLGPGGPRYETLESWPLTRTDASGPSAS